jgi:preprotein translocase subunit SecF
MKPSPEFPVTTIELGVVSVLGQLINARLLLGDMYRENFDGTTHSLTHSLIHSLTHTLTHSLTHSLTHLLTYLGTIALLKEAIIQHYKTQGTRQLQKLITGSGTHSLTHSR